MTTFRLSGRRVLSASVIAAAAIAVFPSTGTAMCPTADPCPTLPTVNMTRVVLAASLDPSRTDYTTTAGAADDVKKVEQALDARGYLATSEVDGYWARATTAAWGRFEVNGLGESGRAIANGLPGLDELRNLGVGRFQLSNVIDVGSRVTLTSVANGGNSDDGQDVVNERTKAMFLEAQKIMRTAGQTGSDMVIIQGGYCYPGCASDSAGTHNGGGSIDIRTWDTTTTGINNRVAALRKVGFAAWYRNFAGNQHIHAVAIGDYQASWEAHGRTTAPAPLNSDYSGNCQIYEYKFFFDGLGGCDDRVPSSASQRDLVTWEQYLAG